jgi:pyrroloquinoline-quinone synthase
MNDFSFWRAMHDVIGRFDLAQHPFYQSWMAGTLTQDDLREYAVEYYPHVAAFPGYLRKFANRLPFGVLRMRVYQNLTEELGMTEPSGRPHEHLWMVFAENMGADPAKIKTTKPSSNTQQLMSVFEQLAVAGTEAETLAAFYVYESQVASLAAHKAAALRDCYHACEATCEYFVLHSTVEIRHAKVWHEQLEKAIEGNPDEARRAIDGADVAARALWDVLDGLQERRECRGQ